MTKKLQAPDHPEGATFWQTRFFQSYDKQVKWTAKNGHRFQIVPLFVNNGFAVEFKKLRSVY